MTMFLPHRIRTDAGTYEAIFTTPDDIDVHIDVAYTVEARDETEARTLLWEALYDDHPGYLGPITMTVMKDGDIL